MQLLRIDASLRVEGSVSRAVANTFMTAWQEEHPDGIVKERDLGQNPLPMIWPAAVTGFMSPPEVERTAEQIAAKETVAGLADELLAADALLIASPLYNFSAPLHLKQWVDLLLTDTRVREPSPWLAGKSAVLVVARGGGYGEGTPRHGWDHLTPWLKQILADSWGLDLTIVAAELTLAGVNPALEQFIPIAKESLAAAHVEAEHHGRRLGALTAA